jgi:hypothetical protein
VIVAGGAVFVYRPSPPPPEAQQAAEVSASARFVTPSPAVASATPIVPAANPPAASAEPAPATNAFRPPGAFRDGGRATPQDAAGTLFWNTWSLDYPALARMLVFADGDRERVDTVFSRIPEHVRTTMKLRSPEELFAFLWSMENSERYIGLRLGATDATAPDSASVNFAATTSNDGAVAQGTMSFRRGTDGWQWVVPTTVLDGMEERARVAAPKLNNNAPGWARDLAKELYVDKPERGK